jgi:hypothetical protein
MPIGHAQAGHWPHDPAAPVASNEPQGVVSGRIMPPVSGDGYASLADMQAWAQQVMATPPDFVIGADYLRRWWIVPRNEGCNVYLHEICRSDDDRAMHDHPWDNTSYLLFGSYIEHTPSGRFMRMEGDVIQRRATDLHRLEVFEGDPPVVSLFITGPKVREWGFACPQGWVHWQDFCAPGDSSKVGRGCGEHHSRADDESARGCGEHEVGA